MAKTILVVDDSPTEVRVILSALEGKGYQFVTAADGEEALEKCTGFRPDLILLDIILPKRNGYQVCREIKGRKSPPKIIMVSSKDQDSDKFWGMRQGADGYLTKPIDLKLLASTVEEMLVGQSLTAEN
jgi:twitching motility two-component system response regulator PilH